MLNKAWHFITIVLGLFVTICMLYIIGMLFGIIPKNYLPAQIFPKQYNSFMTYLAKDAESKSSTAGFSDALYDYINDTATASPAVTPPDSKSDNPTSPIDKAKAAVDSYNQSMQNEKQKLDQY
jgi:hypothetical protein